MKVAVAVTVPVVGQVDTELMAMVTAGRTERVNSAVLEQVCSSVTVTL